MSVQSCSNCFALLPAADTQLSCPYCGTPTGRAHAAPADIRKRNETLTRVGLMAFAVLFVAAPLLGLFRLGYLSKTPDVGSVVHQADDLQSLGETAGEITPIGQVGLGPLATFNPLVQLSWFTKLAATWSTDARLTRLELHGVHADGTLDLSKPISDAYARFEFASASHSETARRQHKVVDTDAWSAIDVEVKGGVVRALVIKNSNADRQPSPVVFACNVQELVALWRKKGLPVKETYDVELKDQGVAQGDFVWQCHDWGVPKVGLDCKVR